MRVAPALVVLPMFLSCGGPTAPSGPATISGRVIDYVTGTGVAGTTVTFGHSFESGIQFVMTDPHAAVADASGFYAVSLPTVAHYDVVVNGVEGKIIGSAEITAPDYRGDLLTRAGTCVARYGVIADATTRRPVANGTVSLGAGTVTTAADGWYRIDLGCPENGRYGFGTTMIYVSHPAYADFSQVAGRGVSGVTRQDVALQRR